MLLLHSAFGYLTHFSAMSLFLSLHFQHSSLIPSCWHFFHNFFPPLTSVLPSFLASPSLTYVSSPDIFRFSLAVQLGDAANTSCSASRRFFLSSSIHKATVCPPHKPRHTFTVQPPSLAVYLHLFTQLIRVLFALHLLPVVLKGSLYA